MAKKDKDIEDLIRELGKDVTRVMDNKGTNEVKEVYREEVEYMYREFNPLSYPRRYADGGFADESNWDSFVDLKGDNITLELVNETKAVNSIMRLDEIIEKGVYDWKGNNPVERPVYERTDERLKKEQVIENVLESELKRLGYKFN